MGEMGANTKFTACNVGTDNFKCFEKLTAEERKLMDDNSVVINYRKGETIYKQGGFFSQIMLMEKGLAKVILDNSGNSLVLKIICDGNLIGLSSVAEEHNTYHYSAIAYVDSQVRQIDVGAFRKLLSINTEFAREVIDILIANSIQIYGRFFSLTNKQAYGRLADILLCLSDRVFKERDFELPLSRKDLGELSGMSTETVIRILKKFNEEKLIMIEKSRFVIIDYEKLMRISETG